MKGISVGAELKTLKRRLKRCSRERGFTVIASSLGLFCMLGMAGLAIDISHLYLAGTELQNAADAAALAGASALDGTSGGVTAAADRALSTLNKPPQARTRPSRERPTWCGSLPVAPAPASGTVFRTFP